MKNTNRRLFGFLLAAVAAAGLSLIGASQGWAQEKHRIYYKSPPGKYLQKLAVDVGDVPGHQVAVFELQFRFTTDAPAYDGVKAVEQFTRGVTNLTNGNGRNTGHLVVVLENGDKIFSEYDSVLHATVNPDGSRQARYYAAFTITGGTGKFKAIRGLVRGTGVTDFKTGVTDQQNEGEYWFAN